jgi:hypothetical protein
MLQQFWGYKVEEKLHLGVRTRKVEYHWSSKCVGAFSLVRLPSKVLLRLAISLKFSWAGGRAHVEANVVSIFVLY